VSGSGWPSTGTKPETLISRGSGQKKKIGRSKYAKFFYFLPFIFIFILRIFFPTLYNFF
jgi:hypothetical protein